MIINLELKTDKDGKLEAEPSKYDPSDEVKAITKQVMEDFASSDKIRNQTYKEFNDINLIDRQSRDQMAFNNFEPGASDDPDEEWRSTAVRPITRNKIISIAAHITGNLMFPKIFAQNDNDQEDKDSASAMRDLMEWSYQQSEYEQMFLFAVIAALVNPAVIVHTEFRKVMRIIKEINSKDEIIEKEIVDEELSGFQDTLVPIDELWIENIYENNIQKQGNLHWRRVIDYSLAQSKHRGNEIFEEFVRPGLQFLLLDEHDTFYEQYDDELADSLVEEIIYYNRQLDLQLTFVNGILLDRHNEPNPRKDKKYPFAKTGYELIDEGKFFYYKSSAFKTAPDADVVDNLYRMIIDGTYLQLMPPVAIFGDEQINASVTMPGAVTAFQNENSRLERIDVGNDLAAGFNTLAKVEESISESTQDPQQAGVSAPGQQTAFEISRLEQNARVQLGIFGKMIGFLVRDWGQLRLSDIVQHLTVAELKEITGEGDALKFRSFLIPDKEGASTKRIRLTTEEVPEESITEEEALGKSFEVMEEEGGIDSKDRLIKVNPELLRRLKFLVVVSPDVVFPPSDNVKKALMLEQYDRAVANPLADQQAIYEKLLLGSYEATRDNPEKFIRKDVPATSPEQGGGEAGVLKRIVGAEKPATPEGVL